MTKVLKYDYYCGEIFSIFKLTMKIRTCPNCGYKYSFLQYLKNFLFKFIDSNLTCANCGSTMSFSMGRRIFVAIVAMLPFGFSTFIADIFQNMGLSKSLSWVVFFLILTIWTIMIYSLDTFTKRDKYRT